MESSQSGLWALLHRFAAGLLLLLVMPCCRAADPAPTPVHPVQAELVGPLDILRLKDGGHFAARIVEDWKGTGCHLQIGSLLEGHVLQVVRRSKTEKSSSFQVSFERAKCDGTVMGDLPLTVIALVGPFGAPTPGGASGLSEAPPLADLPGLSIGGGGIAARPGIVNTNSMRSVEAAADINAYTQVVRQVRKLPSQILPGAVIDVPRTELHVGTGVGGASIVSSSKDARLEARTTLILLPSSSYMLHKTRVVADYEGGAATGANPGAGSGAAPANVASGGAVSPAEPAPEEADATRGLFRKLQRAGFVEHTHHGDEQGHGDAFAGGTRVCAARQAAGTDVQP